MDASGAARPSPGGNGSLGPGTSVPRGTDPPFVRYVDAGSVQLGQWQATNPLERHWLGVRPKLHTGDSKPSQGSPSSLVSIDKRSTSLADEPPPPPHLHRNENTTYSGVSSGAGRVRIRRLQFATSRACRWRVHGAQAIGERDHAGPDPDIAVGIHCRGGDASAPPGDRRRAGGYSDSGDAGTAACGAQWSAPPGRPDPRATS